MSRRQRGRDDAQHRSAYTVWRAGPFRFRGTVNDGAVVFLLLLVVAGICLIPGLIMTLVSR